jgi:hypothetical protein
MTPGTTTEIWNKLMKQFGILFALVCCMMAISSAQQSAGMELYLSSGYVIPSSPMTFANYWNMQAGGGVGAGIHLSETITLVGLAEHYRFKLSSQGVTDGFNTGYMRDIWIFKDVSLRPSADASSVTTISANLRIAPLRPSRLLSPYFVAGVGLMISSLSEIALPTTSVLSVNGSDISMTAQQRITGGNDTAPFFQFGLGMDFRFADSFGAFLEARYANGLNKGLGTSILPMTLGIKLGL